MGFYRNSAEFYRCAGVTIQQVQVRAPEAAQALLRSGLAIRMSLHDPEAVITVSGKRESLEVTFGDEAKHAELLLQLSADTLHGLLLAELSIRKALGGKLIRVRGPVLKLMPLGGLIQAAQAIYPEILVTCRS